MRMRTINEASAFLRESDPETALTKTALRRLVVTGVIPSVKVGNKFLISLESLEAYLKCGVSQLAEKEPDHGIRRVGV